MTQNRKHIELLAPAGNFEKLEIAIHYGADAVYLAGKEFSLRNFSGNFSLDEMKEAVRFAHKQNVRVYVACNVYSRSREKERIVDYLKHLARLEPDAVIAADPGVIYLAGQHIPNMPIHLSTQANTTNLSSALFWKQMGIVRVNTARELSLEEIRIIAEPGQPNPIQIEAFVHGAMCISYSGRCLLSSFMTNRDSNRGMCSHPCRWKYYLLEEQRPGKYMPVSEDDRGTYIFNSYDLCMIEHIPALIEAGIHSLKIEGRMKGINYLASTVKTYRHAIDTYYDNPKGYRVDDEWIRELNSITNRGYSTGFYFGRPEQTIPNLNNIKPETRLRFVGKVLDSRDIDRIKIEVRNKIFTGDEIEILGPDRPVACDRIDRLSDSEGRPLEFAQPGSIACIRLMTPCAPNDLIRKKTLENEKP